jgi:hypothetical protein
VGYGVPGAAATGQQSLECLPAALDDDKGMQPLAAVIGGESEQEWALAVEKIAAGLSGRSLKDYHLAINWQKTRRLAIGSLGFAILLLFAYALSGLTTFPISVTPQATQGRMAYGFQSSPYQLTVRSV